MTARWFIGLVTGAGMVCTGLWFIIIELVGLIFRWPDWAVLGILEIGVTLIVLAVPVMFVSLIGCYFSSESY